MADEVRLATRVDEPQIIHLLHMMHAENALLPLSEDRAREFFDRAFDKKGGIIGVIGPPGDIRAMLYLLISRWWYTDENHLEEMFNFVRPDMRKTDYARTLLDFAKECSDSIKIPLVIGVLAHTRMEGKVRLYRRSFGLPAGAFFVYGANWVNAEPSNFDFWKAPFPERKKTNGHSRPGA